MGEEHEAHTDPQSIERETPRWSTSPPGGKTHEGTKPPRQGDVDQGAFERSRDALNLAAGEQ